jgi:hypothetical protein
MIIKLILVYIRARVWENFLEEREMGNFRELLDIITIRCSFFTFIHMTIEIIFVYTRACVCEAP